MPSLNDCFWNGTPIMTWSVLMLGGKIESQKTSLQVESGHGKARIKAGHSTECKGGSTKGPYVL